jgi:hydroxymethylpyrimidine/phosphomethylpyrimidine kinase
MNTASAKTVLAVSGLDPSGGAGLLIDAAAIRAAGCHASGVVSVSTIQDGEHFYEARTADLIHFQTSIETVLGGMDVGAVKVGALKSVAGTEVAARIFARPGTPKVVIDPVILSTSGGRLLDEDAISVVKTSLFRTAALVTPNLLEAGLLAGIPVQTIDDMILAASRILDFGPAAVLVKGGHLKGNTAEDVFADNTGEIRILHPIPKLGYEVRGTGCALSSLIAAWIARGLTTADAIEQSRSMLNYAVQNACDVGKGPRVLGDFFCRCGI